MAQLASAKQAIPPTEDLLQVYNQKQIRSEEVKSNLIHTRTRVRSPLQGSPYSAEEYQTAQLKKSQNFLGSVGYRTILAKHLTSFVFAAQHHLFHKQNIPCDAIMESSFPWQHYWIPPCVEDSDMPFFVPNISVEFVSAFKQFSLPNHLPTQKRTISHK